MREFKIEILNADFVIVGGGLAGVCAAITAARERIRVILVQDRPVLGGNASSEVRLWALGATAHMGSNNRWSREGGVIDEILTENLYRNPEGNPILFDMVLLDAVRAEPNIQLLLNTAMDTCTMKDRKTIGSVSAYNSQNETKYEIRANLFCDCTGDGTLGYLVGAEYVMGKDELSNRDQLQYPESFGELLGSTIFFYTKKVAHPVRYVPPNFALKDFNRLKRLNRISADAQGCDYWWIEWSAQKNTVHDSEEIKMELWSIVYGIWDYIKNSGKFPETENYTLEWVGCIPGKRESRRFVGDYTLNQKDLVEQRRFNDTVSFGGWALDHHPSGGSYSDFEPCYQWHTKGIYSVPYRCMYSRNIDNLFMGGRLISATRAAFGSTRVMMTCAGNAQPVGVAAMICTRNGILPRGITENKELCKKLQNHLLRGGQFIPGVPSVDPSVNKSLKANIESSGRYFFDELSPDGDWYRLEHDVALIFPVNAGKVSPFILWADAREKTEMEVQLCIAEKEENYLPEIVLEKMKISIEKGAGKYKFAPSSKLEKDSYLFIRIKQNQRLSIKRSTRLLTAVNTVYNKFEKKVAKSAEQIPSENSGIDQFKFWTPYRRPDAQNLAIRFENPLDIFSEKYLINGFHRPFIRSNAWLAKPKDIAPYIILRWDEIQEISVILLFFDTDFDFAMESVQMHHSESVLPFCITEYQIYDEANKTLLFEKKNNYSSLNKINVKVKTDALRIEFIANANKKAPKGLFGIQCI